MKEREEKITNIKTECSCGCCILKIEEIEVYTDDEIQILQLPKSKKYDYSLQILINTFYSKQRGILRTIKERIKLIWYILLGKDYLLNDIILSKDQADEFNKSLQNLLNKE